ncbi:Fur family transcriptional regulator [Thiohalomonas denitrificans]|uniref:Fur family transcriptional regulator, zinc uptake regulator n=1 Tax=Thiohalomonas denitrificans TaxID=415747 RepID=A0A1G5PQ75_9GAMM|nr:Fur family transcriptional regulator [Thiohalomonas denitrificans]SCZ51572.1 Fur family transcriptional regulator, zinc uptake regulator [Thiohalomonas denitrificans]
MNHPAIIDPFSAGEHDHCICIQDALSRAADVCRHRGARLTAQRQQVLELIWSQHKPIGAYEILEAMQAAGVKAAPPTVYRALDFLLAQGLVHRIESRNAFTGCCTPETRHNGQFLVCSECGMVAELADEGLSEHVRERAERSGFEARHQTIEVSGICPRCRDTADG